MADKIQVWTAGVLTQQWDDATSTYTQYDPATGALTLSRAYTAQETSAAQARTTDATARTNLDTIMSRMQTAISDNQAFLAIASPTNAQILARVTPLTRQIDGIMRVLGHILDNTN